MKNKILLTSVGLGGLYLFTRLYNLLLLPIFTDESIYIYWAKFIVVNHSNWFISLVDGKPPLLIWIIASFITVFPSEWYLLAGRLPSVLAGIGSLVAISLITYHFTKQLRFVTLAGILYIFHPFLLFYDRLALFDSLLSCMLLWSVYFALKTAETFSYKHALLWGGFLGLALLSKPTALLFLVLTPASFLLVTNFKMIKEKFSKIVLLFLVMGGVAEVINNLQRLSSVYDRAAMKNAQFQQPLEKLLANPFELTLGNLGGFYSWILGYYTLPFLLLTLVSFIILLFFSWRKGVILFMLWFVPIFALATIGREIFPRYILFTTPYALLAIVLAAYYVVTKRSIPYSGVVGGIALCSLLFIPFDFSLLTNPPLAPFPVDERKQFISEHPSGYGIQEVMKVINKEKEKQPITLVIQGTFGIYPYAFTLEYWDDPQITLLPRWPLETLDQEILDARKKGPVYVLLKEYDEIPSQLPLDLILKSEKPGGMDPLLLTKLKEL